MATSNTTTQVNRIASIVAEMLTGKKFDFAVNDQVHVYFADKGVPVAQRRPAEFDGKVKALNHKTGMVEVESVGGWTCVCKAEHVTRRNARQ